MPSLCRGQGFGHPMDAARTVSKIEYGGEVEMYQRESPCHYRDLIPVLSKLGMHATHH